MIQRTYLVGSRLYQTITVIRTDQRGFEGAAIKVLDSFKILDEATVAAKLATETSKAKPDPLPQEPVATRAGTDANDHGLHGKVKTVLEEMRSQTGTWSVQTRKRDFFETYNEQGHLTRRESYDYKGNLYDVTVYGYIDGGRVSQLKTISRPQNPPPSIVSPVPGAVVKKSDPRYQTRFEFKYDDQKHLIERSLFRSNGDRFRQGDHDRE